MIPELEYLRWIFQFLDRTWSEDGTLSETVQRVVAEFGISEDLAKKVVAKWLTGKVKNES